MLAYNYYQLILTTFIYIKYYLYSPKLIISDYLRFPCQLVSI